MKIFFIFISIISFLSLSLNASSIKILEGDIEKLSLESSQSFSESLIDIMKNFVNEKQILDLKKILTMREVDSFNPKNLKDFSSALPLPSETIFRLSKSKFFLENEFVAKKNIIYSYGSAVSIEFELMQASPNNPIYSGPAGMNKQANLALLAGSFAMASYMQDRNSESKNLSPSQPGIRYETTEYKSYYGLDAIGASNSYSNGWTGKDITVSVLDNTYDTDHPDLVDVFVTGYNAVDDSTNVHCEDNTAMNGGDNTGCSNHHGTHVAGTIAANKDGVGMHGVAYNAKIKPIVMANGAWGDSVSTAELILAIQAGTGSGIVAMNNSWGYTTTATYTLSGTQYYYRLPYNQSNTVLTSSELAAWEAGAADTVIVFANSNHGMNTLNGRVNLYSSASNALTKTNTAGYVINADHMDVNMAGWMGAQGHNSNLAGKWLTVVALDNNNVIATYSNGCALAKAFCISAPGSGIYSTVDTVGGDTYDTYNGTSMAAPHVTGALAILAQQFPNLTSTELVTLIIDSATDLGAAGVDAIYGVGMLNLAEATKPSGASVIAAREANAANVASGLSSSFGGSPSPLNTSIITSSAFGNTLNKKNISVGILDEYKRSYLWNPNYQQNVQSNYVLNDFINLTNKDKNKDLNLFKNENTRVSFIDNLDINKINIDYKLNNVDIEFKTNDINNYFNYLDENNTELRFNKIESTNKNVLSLSTNYTINKNYTLNTIIGNGKFNNNNSFKESSINLKINKSNKTLRFGVGTINEEGQFLGSYSSGAYSIKDFSKSFFYNLESRYKLNKDLLIHSNYTKFDTMVDMAYDNFVNIKDLKSNEFSTGIIFSNLMNNKGKVKFNYTIPLATTSGELTHYTTKGYKTNGSYNSVTEKHSLRNDSRESRIDLMYDYKILPNMKILSMINYTMNDQGVKNKNNYKVYSSLSFSF